MTTTTDDAFMQAYRAAGRREAQDQLAASIARLKALLKHLQEAAKQDDPYDWLAITPAPGFPDPRARYARARQQS
jgi:hypothetical protein